MTSIVAQERDRAAPSDERLDRMLLAMEVQVSPFAVCDIEGGAALTMPAYDVPTLHYVLAGSGEIRVSAHGSFGFGPGSLIVCPPGLGQRVRAFGAPGVDAGRPETQCANSHEGIERLRTGAKDGQDGIRAVMACGRIEAEDGPFHSLRLPIVESFRENSGLRHAFDALLAEIESTRPGARALAETLMKQCLIYLLRRLYDCRDARLPWLAAVADPRLGLALDEIFREPAAPLSVEALAGMAGMSRSAFNQRFRSALGRPPHEFVTDLRLARAARLLMTTGMPVKSIAGHVGYGSRSHFSRAFKARYGVDPLGFRLRERG